jgi:hypothetical protein
MLPCDVGPDLHWGIKRLWVVASCLAFFFVGSAVYAYTTLPDLLPYAEWRIMRFAFSNDGKISDGARPFPLPLERLVVFPTTRSNTV